MASIGRCSRGWRGNHLFAESCASDSWRTIALMAKTLEERGDPRLVFGGEVTVSF